MSNMRVHQLAKKLGISSKDLIRSLEENGVAVTSHMSAIDEETVQIMQSLYSAGRQEERQRQTLVSKKKTKKKKPKTSRRKISSMIADQEQSELSGKVVQFHEGMMVRELADAMEVSGSRLVSELVMMGKMLSMNQAIDVETAKKLGEKYGYDVVEKVEKVELPQMESEPQNLTARYPVVTVLGHVDHGKTTLLDALRKTNVVDKEAGGITQHIGASVIEAKDGKIVFIDTPGHEAFTTMRARGADITDIVVLVVAADDSIMPQTIEAINHARAAEVPIIVAVNKIDKANANTEKVKQDLMQYNLVPEEWGGETIVCEISAKQKIGIEDLLDMILLQAEIMELKADPTLPARGVVIESRLDKGRGPVATLLVQQGILRTGDPFVSGCCYGKVRALFDDRGNSVKEAHPATPVEVLGFSRVPEAGESLAVIEDEKTAKGIAESREESERQKQLAKASRVCFDDIFTQIQEGEAKILRVILKGDTQGAVEAIASSLRKLDTEKVKIDIIHTGIGNISETDVVLASASNALIIGFNVGKEQNAPETACRECIDIKLYNVIYELLDDIRLIMEGLLDPVYQENVTGRLEVRQVFKISRLGAIAGCMVNDGFITRNSNVRILRNDEEIFQGKVNSLKRFKEDVSEVKAGYECGVGVSNFHDFQEGDVIEAFELQKVPASASK